jgi:hypothetical protein
MQNSTRYVVGRGDDGGAASRSSSCFCRDHVEAAGETPCGTDGVEAAWPNSVAGASSVYFSPRCRAGGSCVGYHFHVCWPRFSSLLP